MKRHCWQCIFCITCVCIKPYTARMKDFSLKTFSEMFYILCNRHSSTGSLGGCTSSAASVPCYGASMPSCWNENEHAASQPPNPAYGCSFVHVSWSALVQLHDLACLLQDKIKLNTFYYHLDTSKLYSCVYYKIMREHDGILGEKKI